MKHCLKTKVISFLAGAALLCAFLPASTLADTVKIGAILAESGPAGFLGKPEAKTLQMLVEQVNARGGVDGKHKVELLIRDSAGKKEQAVSLAKQLIEEDKVFAILGPTRSGSTMAIKKIMEQAKTILISCASTKKIVDPVAKYVFKTPQNDSLAARMILQEMKKQGITKIAVVVGGTGFGKMGKMFVNKLAPEYGISVLINETYSPKATDLSPLVTKLKSNKEIQGIVNWSIVPAQTILAKNMKQQKLNLPLFLSHGFGNIKYVQAGGPATEGIMFPAGRLLIADTLPADNPQRDVLVKYKNDYESKYHEPVSTFGGHAFDAFKILCKGIQIAGSLDKEKVRSAIENMTFVGTGGIFHFTPADHSGLKIDAFDMMVVKNGKFAKF